MDTNICLYCEKHLEKVNIYQSVFCSRLCHEKESLKAAVPSLELLQSISKRNQQFSFIRKSIRNNVHIVSPSSITSLESL